MTPRRQAVTATLAGIAAGAAIVAVVAVVRDDSGTPAAQHSSSVAPATVSMTPPQPDAGPLSPTELRYERRTFGKVALEAPKGWKYVKQGAGNAWFTGPDSVWRLRVDTSANPKTIDQMMTARERSLRSTTQELKILSRTKGSQEIAWSPGTLTHRTLTYSYLNKDRGHRLVINRFIALGDGGRTALEITASGRPEDEPGLAAALAQATTTLVLSA
jgi:hypothetical protein